MENRVIDPELDIRIFVPRHEYFYFYRDYETVGCHKVREYGFIEAFAVALWKRDNQIELLPIDSSDGFWADGGMEYNGEEKMFKDTQFCRDRYRTLDLFYLKLLIKYEIVQGQGLTTKMRALQNVKRRFIEHDIILTPRVREIFEQVDLDDENPKRIKI